LAPEVPFEEPAAFDEVPLEFEEALPELLELPAFEPLQPIAVRLAADTANIQVQMVLMARTPLQVTDPNE
jgi:hypothetical protein